VALRRGVTRQLDHLRELDAHPANCDREIAQQASEDPRAQSVSRLAGVGVLTASALTATVVDPQQFRCGRQFAAWIGLTPRQYSTGGKARLGRITRRGDSYLRCLLVQGARSALQAAMRAAPPRRTRLAAWIVATYQRIVSHRLPQDIGGDRQQARPADWGPAQPRRAAASARRRRLNQSNAFADCEEILPPRWSDRRCAQLANLAAALRGRRTNEGAARGF